MSHEFDAIFEGGVFRPLGEVNLPDKTKVHLSVRDSEDLLPNDDLRDAQKAAMRELLQWLSKRPPVAASERISAVDHDQILYGWRK